MQLISKVCLSFTTNPSADCEARTVAISLVVSNGIVDASVS